RAERIADALGAPPDANADGSRAVRAVRELLGRIGCPPLRTLGVTEADLEPLTELALAGWIPIEPGPWDREDIAAAYSRALAVTG
ncbi:MAG: alcohol dehydrogenase, partial [Solirubrobacteraceae bacterium]